MTNISDKSWFKEGQNKILKKLIFQDHKGHRHFLNVIMIFFT